MEVEQVLGFWRDSEFYAWELLKFMTFFYAVWAPGFIVAGLLSCRFRYQVWNSMLSQPRFGFGAVVKAVAAGVVGSAGRKATLVHCGSPAGARYAGIACFSVLACRPKYDLPFLGSFRPFPGCGVCYWSGPRNIGDDWCSSRRLAGERLEAHRVAPPGVPQGKLSQPSGIWVMVGGALFSPGKPGGSGVLRSGVAPVLALPHGGDRSGRNDLCRRLAPVVVSVRRRLRASDLLLRLHQCAGGSVSRFRRFPLTRGESPGDSRAFQDRRTELSRGSSASVWPALSTPWISGPTGRRSIAERSGFWWGLSIWGLCSGGSGRRGSIVFLAFGLVCRPRIWQGNSFRVLLSLVGF